MAIVDLAGETNAACTIKREIPDSCDTLKSKWVYKNVNSYIHYIQLIEEEGTIDLRFITMFDKFSDHEDAVEPPYFEGTYKYTILTATMSLLLSGFG